MAWRNCNASISLINDINAKWPGRDKASDGTIGDAAHAARTSDHNPWIVVGGVGVVRARDIDKDGIDAAWLAEQLRICGQNGDPRLANGGYIIFNRRITSPDFKSWNAYLGSNPHTAHIHVSFTRDLGGFDRTDSWAFLGGGVVLGPSPSPSPVTFPSAPTATADGRWIQERLTYWGFSVGVDGIVGPKTTEAIRNFQRSKGLVADGIVGPKTRAALAANKVVARVAPPWPLPRDHYFGLITGPARSHGGINASERGHVKLIQQALIRKGYVPGQSNPNSGWADGKYEQATKDAVTRFQRAQMPGTTRFGEVWWDDWAKLLS